VTLRSDSLLVRRSWNVFNLDAIPFFLEIFRDETTVTMLRLFFTALQARAVEETPRYRFIYTPRPH
jgi:hypothetical protein